jgi:hypothetical protein
MDWSIVTGTAGSITGIAALLISASTAARAARAERPVEWRIDHVPLGDHGAVTVQISCEGADALSLVAEGHHQLEDSLPGFWIQRQPVLAIGKTLDMTFPPNSLDGGWIVLSWCHPRDRLRPIRAWFPVAASGTAYDEYMRQSTSHPLARWLRGHLLLSPVRPGGIPGRRTGWRDRRIVRRELVKRGVKRWRPQLPYEEQKS